MADVGGSALEVFPLAAVLKALGVGDVVAPLSLPDGSPIQDSSWSCVVAPQVDDDAAAFSWFCRGVPVFLPASSSISVHDKVSDASSFVTDPRWNVFPNPRVAFSSGWAGPGTGMRSPKLHQLVSRMSDVFNVDGRRRRKCLNLQMFHRPAGDVTGAVGHPAPAVHPPMARHLVWPDWCGGDGAEIWRGPTADRRCRSCSVGDGERVFSECDGAVCVCLEHDLSEGSLVTLPAAMGDGDLVDEAAQLTPTPTAATIGSVGSAECDNATRVSCEGAVTWWHIDDAGEAVLQVALRTPACVEGTPSEECTAKPSPGCATVHMLDEDRVRRALQPVAPSYPCRHAPVKLFLYVAASNYDVCMHDVESAECGTVAAIDPFAQRSPLWWPDAPDGEDGLRSRNRQGRPPLVVVAVLRDGGRPLLAPPNVPHLVVTLRDCVMVEQRRIVNTHLCEVQRLAVRSQSWGGLRSGAKIYPYVKPDWVGGLGFGSACSGATDSGGGKIWWGRGGPSLDSKMASGTRSTVGAVVRGESNRRSSITGCLVDSVVEALIAGVEGRLVPASILRAAAAECSIGDASADSVRKSFIGHLWSAQCARSLSAICGAAASWIPVSSSDVFVCRSCRSRPVPSLDVDEEHGTFFPSRASALRAVEVLRRRYGGLLCVAGVCELCLLNCLVPRSVCGVDAHHSLMALVGERVAVVVEPSILPMSYAVACLASTVHWTRTSTVRCVGGVVVAWWDDVYSGTARSSRQFAVYVPYALSGLLSATHAKEGLEACSLSPFAEHDCAHGGGSIPPTGLTAVAYVQNRPVYGFLHRFSSGPLDASDGTARSVEGDFDECVHSAAEDLPVVQGLVHDGGFVLEGVAALLQSGRPRGRVRPLPPDASGTLSSQVPTERPLCDDLNHHASVLPSAATHVDLDAFM